MSLVKWALIGLVVLPGAELVGLLLMVMLLGWLWAGLAFVGTSVLGVLLRPSRASEAPSCLATSR